MEQSGSGAIEQRVKHILTAELQADPAAIAACTTDTPLLGRGIGLDSIEAMALALSLEREFDIQVPDADLTVELFSSLGTLAQYVARQIGAQHPSPQP